MDFFASGLPLVTEETPPGEAGSVALVMDAYLFLTGLPTLLAFALIAEVTRKQILKCFY